MKCKGAGGKKRNYVYYNCENCHVNIREKYVEEKFKDLFIDLVKFDEEYNQMFLPLFADKEKIVERSDIENEIINLTKQKERIKKAYLSEVVEIDDFKEDLKVINEKLTTLEKQLEQSKQYKEKNILLKELLHKEILIQFSPVMQKIIHSLLINGI